jgi:signal transduction histidine kinase/CheY-like chemotaxis protein
MVRVLKSGRPELLTREHHPAGDAVYVDKLAGLDAGSAIVAPLAARGRTFGAIAWVRGGPVAYAQADVDVAHELARRAAAAVDNARLFQQITASDRRKDEFLATMAHELRNPLAPIRNAVAVMAAKGPPDPELVWSREVIARQVGQMARLLDDLLDVSRITRNKLELRRQRVTLDDVIDSAVETSRPLLDAHGHTLTVELPATPVLLDGDPVRLAQVFSNLLNNAAKYTDRGGRVRLTAERREGAVAVTVADTGIGIARETLPRLFEMFSQAAPAIDRAQGGLGIGLALVKGLVQMHGGTVEANSEGPGRGSTFVVTLPVVAAASPPPRPAEPPRPARAGGRTIVVADDNLDAAESLALWLEVHGQHDVRVAHDGRQALAVTVESRPDIVLLDIGMPGLNGYEVARAIREQPWGATTVLVALTGWGQEEDKRRARAAGFDRHMTKPVDPVELERVLAELAAARRP